MRAGLIGETISHYKLKAVLGQGGMGVVYRARDERLERDIALKVLPAGALAGENERRQFRREARALCSLSHPHIAVLHDFGQANGIDYLVMELIEGESLEDRIARGPLPEPETFRLGVQIAHGLEAAHRRGILHLDLKPSNVRLTPEGDVKIVDFGLARVVHAPQDVPTQTLTVSHQIAGTIPYMAPERLLGSRGDARSDVFSLGAVLYEMATGRRPFRGESPAALAHAVAYGEPEPPRALRRDLSQGLERIVLRALAKDPSGRFPDARALSAALESGTTGGPAAKPRSHRAAVLASIAGVAAVLSLTLGLVFNVGGIRRLFLPSSSTVGFRSLAVLPLANLSGDSSQDYFADGMTDELITRLAQVGALRVIARSSVMQYKGSSKPVRQVARELHVGMVVEGSVARAGDQVRVTVQLVDAGSERNLWAEVYERTLSNVLLLQSEVAKAIVQRIAVKVTPGERNRIASAPPVVPEAHEAYLQGLGSFNLNSTDGYNAAIRHFDRSIQLDPTYAPAYSGLANTYLYMSGFWLPSSEAIPRARAAAMRALALDPNLGPARASLAYVKMIYDWDWRGAEAEYRRALASSPGEVTIHQNFGAFLVCVGRFDEASAEFERARSLDPLSSLLGTMSLWPLFEGRRFVQADSAARQLIAADPTSYAPHMVLGQSLFFRGSQDEGIAEIRRATELDPQNPFPLGWLGYAYGMAGQKAQATSVWDRLVRMSRNGYVQPYLFALTQLGLGHRSEALDWLEKAGAVRSDELGFLDVDPAMDALREEPRFQAIIREIGFPSHRPAGI